MSIQRSGHPFSLFNEFSVDYFFVAVDQQRKNYRLLAVPVSPNYRTKQEDEYFLSGCPIPGAYLLHAEFYATDEQDAKDLALVLFRSDEKSKAAIRA